MTSSSSLGAVAEVREPVRGRNLSKVQIRWSDPDPCDCYARAPRRCICRDFAGYLRARHSYVIERGDGWYCCWCDKRENWMQARGRENKAAPL